MSRHNALFVLFAACLIGGCTSTHLVSSWRDPSFSGPLEFKKILAIAIHPDAVTRRIAEDAMVEQIGSGRATPAYEVVSDADRSSASAVLARAKASGFDGLIAMRIVGNRIRVAGGGEASSKTFADYYNSGAMVSAPAQTPQTQQVTSIETRIYSVSDARLIWSGVSETVNLSNATQTVGEIAKAVRAELRREKLVR